jgi:integrase
VEEDEEQDVKALTEEELEAVLAKVPEKHRLLFRFLAETGLRISECIALLWSDVDLGARRVKVRRRIYKGKAGPPKSKYGRREVPPSRSMAQELWSRHQRDDSPLFPSRVGTPLNPSNTFKVLKRAAREAGFEWVGQPTLRHTFATLLFLNGLNAKQAQIWLGHHSPAFTLATYVHLLPSDLPESPFDSPQEGATEGQPDHTSQPEMTASSLSRIPPYQAESPELPIQAEAAESYS